MAKLIGLILTATLLFGVCKASFNEEFCPEGSQLFLVDPNQDGTCPDVLPTVNTENEANKNKCEEDMNAALTKCGLCMEFGGTNMTKVESNPNYTPKQDVPCMETGERDITMNEATLDRYDWCAKLYEHYWYNHYYKYGWLKVVGAGSRVNHLNYLNDQTSSVRVRPGCTLKLFKHINYDWLLGSLTYDVSALTAYNDQVSSLTCTCTGHPVLTGDTIIYDSNNFKKLAEDKAIIFTVDAKNDAHIGFFSKKKSCAFRCSNEMYEIVIGGWGNSQSVIRRGSQGSNKDLKATHHILKSNEDRSFWADAKNGLVRLGKGKVIGYNIVMKWQDNQPLHPRYVGFMTGWGSTGIWKFS